MEANLFQVFFKLQSNLIILAIIIRRRNFKNFRIEIEPKILLLLKRDTCTIVSVACSLIYILITYMVL